jgi:predicted glycosyltransferase
MMLLQDRPKLLFHVESLWGVGHAVRALRILDELRRDFDCTILSGSTAFRFFPSLYGVNHEVLPEIHFSTDYQHLHSTDGVDIIEILEKRYLATINTFLSVKPNILIVEIFPFGRHLLWKELLCLLELAQNLGIPIITSLRDIYVYPTESERRDEYLEFVKKVLTNYNPLVLIHSDPKVQSIDNAVPNDFRSCKSRFIQTGYIGRSEVACKEPSTGVIRCAIGGGRRGEELLEKVFKMFQILHETRIIELCQGAYASTQLYSYDLNSSFSHIRFSDFSGTRAFEDIDNVAGWIVTGGYNSWMDVLATKVPTIVVPLDEEQKIRSQILSNVCPWVRIASLNQSLNTFIELWNESKETAKVCTLSVDISGASNCLSRIKSEFKDAFNLYSC